MSGDPLSGGAGTDSSGGLPQTASAAEAHLLSLKVMRLSKPTLQLSTATLSTEAGDVKQKKTKSKIFFLFFLKKIKFTFEKNTKVLDEVLGSSSSNAAAANVATGLLALPSAFGQIYLGETFTSYVSLSNGTPYEVTQVVVKAELQTASNRKFMLLDTSAAPATIASVSNADHVVTHDIKEAGQHILGCTASYNTRSGERRQFRKFFRFQVQQPLTVKQKLHSIGHDLLLEVQLTNITADPLVIEAARLDPHAALVATVVDADFDRPDDRAPAAAAVARQCRRGAAASERRLLPATAIRQLLYRLSPRVNSAAGFRAAAAAVNVGKLDITWRHGTGNAGRLQTAHFVHKLAHELAPLELYILDSPHDVVLEREFSLRCEFVNAGTAPMLLSLAFASSVASAAAAAAAVAAAAAAAAAAGSSGGSTLGGSASGAVSGDSISSPRLTVALTPAQSPGAVSSPPMSPGGASSDDGPRGSILGDAFGGAGVSADEGDAPGVVFIGLSGRVLGELGPGESIQATLRAVPVALGLQEMPGIVLVDHLAGDERKKQYEFNRLGTVLVTENNR